MNRPVQQERPFFELMFEPLRNGVYKEKEFHGRGIKIVNMGELFAHDFIGRQDMRRLELSAAEQQKALLKSGDLLFARRSLVLEGAGHCSLVTDVPEPMTFESSLIRVRLDQRLAEPRFYFYLFRSPIGRAKLASIAARTAVSGIKGTDLSALRVPVPALEEQARIASILGAYDDLIEVNRRRIAVLERMARRLFEEWFVHLRFPGHEVLPQMSAPKDWQQLGFGALVDERRDSIDPSDVDPGVAYVGLEHIPRRSTTLDAWSSADQVTSTKLRFERGDILFGKIRPYFHKVAWAPLAGVCSSDAIVWRPRSDDVAGLALAVASSDAFVAHSVQTSNGTKMPRANPSVLARYPVLVPPGMLLQSFNKNVMAGVELAASLNAANLRLAAARDLLLPRLIGGQVSVSTAERVLEAVG